MESQAAECEHQRAPSGIVATDSVRADRLRPPWHINWCTYIQAEHVVALVTRCAGAARFSYPHACAAECFAVDAKAAQSAGEPVVFCVAQLTGISPYGQCSVTLG